MMHYGSSSALSLLELSWFVRSRFGQGPSWFGRPIEASPFLQMSNALSGHPGSVFRPPIPFLTH